MTRAREWRALGLAGVVTAGVACASTQAPPPGDTTRPAARQQAASPARLVVDPDARFWYSDAIPLGHPAADSLVNQNGSPRITDRAAYDRFWADEAPQLAQWSADPAFAVVCRRRAGVCVDTDHLDLGTDPPAARRLVAFLRLGILVEEFSVIHDAANWRRGAGGNFNQVKLLISRHS